MTRWQGRAQDGGGRRTGAVAGRGRAQDGGGRGARGRGKQSAGAGKAERGGGESRARGREKQSAAAGLAERGGGTSRAGEAGPLGPAAVREIAGRLGVRPAKRLGQNFVIDPGTVHRIVTLARLRPDDVVLEVGPGFGSLTLALLPAARQVIAVEVDPVLAAELPRTVAARAPGAAARLEVVTADAAKVTSLPGEPASALVANLPYNVAVPVVLHLLATFPALAHGLVMVQAEVADRMTAPPGSRVYGVPSVKLAWFASARRAGAVPRTVFWPVPNVDSGLVAFTRRAPPVPGVDRAEVFAVIDAAFAQRRKTLRAALARWAGSAAQAEEVLRAAGVDPGARGESLTVTDFAHIVVAAQAPGGTLPPRGQAPGPHGPEPPGGLTAP